MLMNDFDPIRIESPWIPIWGISGRRGVDDAVLLELWPTKLGARAGDDSVGD